MLIKDINSHPAAAADALRMDVFPKCGVDCVYADRATGGVKLKASAAQCGDGDDVCGRVSNGNNGKCVCMCERSLV